MKSTTFDPIPSEFNLAVKVELPKDFRLRWIGALRSGTYPQGRYALSGRTSLYDGNHTYCCMGVAGVLLGISALRMLDKATLSANPTFQSLCYTLNVPPALDSMVMAPLAFVDNSPPTAFEGRIYNGMNLPGLLSAVNDGRIPADRPYNFLAIADWLDRNTVGV